MFCSIVIFLILLEQFAQRYRSRDKKQIRSDDHHDNRNKEHEHRRQGIDDRHCQIIRPGQQRRSYDRQNPVCLRRFLAYILTLQHFYRAQPEDVEDHPQHDKEKNTQKKNCCYYDRLRLYPDRESCLPAKDTDRGKLRQLGKKNAQKKARRNGEHRCQHILPHEDFDQIAFSHPEDVVKSEFFLPSADQK